MRWKIEGQDGNPIVTVLVEQSEPPHRGYQATIDVGTMFEPAIWPAIRAVLKDLADQVEAIQRPAPFPGKTYDAVEADERA